MKMLYLVLLPALAVLCLAYIMYSPLPPGFPETQMRIRLGMYRLIGFISIASGYLGYNRAVVMRDLANYMASRRPKPEGTDIAYKDAVFDGVPVHILTPKGGGVKRGVVYYHGGGFSLGNLQIYNRTVHRMAKDLNVVLVFVDYRLAPEHIFPAAVDDCEKATTYFLQHAAEYGVDKNRIALVGDSAGGTLVATVGYRLHQQHKQQAKLHVLIYPMLGSFNFDSPSYRWNGNGPILTKDMLVHFTVTYLYGHNDSQYHNAFFTNSHTSIQAKQSLAETIMNLDILPNDELKKAYKANYNHGNLQIWNSVKEKLQDPDFCPLYGKKILGKSFPKTYISTCQCDLLRDEGFFYAHYLRGFGVDVTHVNLEVGYHGWMGACKDFEVLEEEFKKLMNFVDSAL